MAPKSSGKRGTKNKADSPPPATLSQLPAIAWRNVKKAIQFLGEEGILYFDNLAETRRVNKGRDVISEATARKLADQIKSRNPSASRAFLLYAGRIVGEQETSDRITMAALEDLR